MFISITKRININIPNFLSSLWIDLINTINIEYLSKIFPYTKVWCALLPGRFLLLYKSFMLTLSLAVNKLVVTSEMSYLFLILCTSLYYMI